MRKSISAEGVSDQAIDQASQWFVELQASEVDSRTRRAFDAWLRKSPENLQAYLEMFPLWDDTARIDPQRAISLDELLALSCRTPIAPFLAQDSLREQVSRPRRLRLALIASALCVCAAAVLTGYAYYSRSTYSTDVGEQRVVVLADGSSIELNSRSRVRVRFQRTEREVDLLDGEALFRVEKDPLRPFVVRSGPTQVRAVGTQFDVYRRSSATTVTVLEGSVTVLPTTPRSSSARLPATDAASLGSGMFVSAGEQVTATPGSVSHTTQANVTVATAWRQRRLVFSATPLPEVAEQFNRYNERQLIVADSRLEHFLVNGVFSSTDPTSLLRFLRAQPDLNVEETDSEIRVGSK